MRRSTWHVVTSSVVLAWLVAAGLAALLRAWLPDAAWLVVHLTMLGAVTTALLVWSWHFSLAVLRAPAPATRRAEALRLGVANAGVLVVVTGVVAERVPGVALGAALLGVAVGAHLVALGRRVRGALPSRFAVTVHAYIAAGLLVLPGIALGVLLEREPEGSAREGRLLLAHLTLNLLGWVGLPILGTLVTLWPTMLRTRLAPSAERQARRALPLLVAGTLMAAVGDLAGLPVLPAFGVLLYLVGFGLTVAPMIDEMRVRRPASFAAWSTLAGVGWLAVSLCALAVVQVRSDELEELPATLVVAALAGGVLQVLLGALSYLLPVMSGGGPAAVRRRNAIVDQAMLPRILVLNAALLVMTLPIVPGLRTVAAVVALACGALTAALLVLGQRQARLP